jgi:hypothetical protein
MGLEWKLQVLPYNHANLNSHSGKQSNVRNLGNLQDFSKYVCTSNKISANSKVVLLSRILIQIWFGLLTGFQKESCFLSFVLSDCKVWSNRNVVLIIYKFGSVWKNRKSSLVGRAQEQCSTNTFLTHATSSKANRGPPVSDPG